MRQIEKWIEETRAGIRSDFESLVQLEQVGTTLLSELDELYDSLEELADARLFYPLMENYETAVTQFLDLFDQDYWTQSVLERALPAYKRADKCLLELHKAIYQVEKSRSDSGV